MTETMYKVLGTERQPQYGGSGAWRKGQWRTVKGDLVPCENGLHFCRRNQLVRWLGPTIWIFEDGSPEETIDHGDKMVTRKGRIVERVNTWDETTARLFVADVAETALQFIPGSHQEPFAAAINAVRGFARGEIGDKERAAAEDAAWDAAGAAMEAVARVAAGAVARAAAGDTGGFVARDAAGAVAWVAARDTAGFVARDAARDAAWVAARAAMEAVARDAARDAARAAAGDTAGVVAGDAAGVVARAAAWDAAWDAARDAQTIVLFDYLEGRRT